MTSEPEHLSAEEVRRILERRAAALAGSPQDERPAETLELLVMHIGDERYGIDIRHIAEVRPLGVVTPVPGLPAMWAGVITLRGVLYPVLDGGRYLGVASASQGSRDVIVIEGNGLVVGLLADAVAGLRRVERDAIDPPLGADIHAHRQAVSGVTRDLLLILDVATLLQDPSLVVDEQAS